MRKILVAIGSRANYGSIKSVLEAVSRHPELSLNIVTFASAVLPKYGNLEEQMRRDGFNPDFSLETQLDGDSVASMAESTGLALLKIPGVIKNLKPDCVVTVGDRYETMATAVSAAYMNVPLAHTMGGEVTGSIDESIRHAISKLSHIHFVSTQKSFHNLVSLGENSDYVFVTGCPRIDLAKKAQHLSVEDVQNRALSFGTGDSIDFNRPFLLISQHPVTSEFESAEKQIRATLESINGLNIQTIVLWPNADAGSEKISKEIRVWKEENSNNTIHFYRNLPPELYLKMMDLTVCLVGNSSSAIREGSFLGTPAVNVGTRQSGREHGDNVLFVDNSIDSIRNAINIQLEHGKYSENRLYGDGNAGSEIAEILTKLPKLSTQKRLNFD